MSVKSIAHAKKDYSWNPSTCICENRRYSKSIVDNSVIVCDEILNILDSVSANITRGWYEREWVEPILEIKKNMYWLKKCFKTCLEKQLGF